MPIIPTDLFSRELADILKREYSKIKVPFDVICLFITGFMTFLCLGRIMGLGVGTVLAAFTMGKVIGMIGKEMDKKVQFVSIMNKRCRCIARTLIHLHFLCLLIKNN